MKKTIILTFLLLLLASCVKNKPVIPDPNIGSQKLISAVDISSYPEIAATNPVFYDTEGKEGDFLDILKDNGVNTIRLRLWVNPIDGHAGFDEVKAFSQTLKSKGFKTWLTLHYSDTWAHPGQQIMPTQWEESDFESLKDSVYTYTEKVVMHMQPDYIQIGNEVNTGILHPQGDIENNSEQFIELLTAGISAVRANSTSTNIIIHFAGIDGAPWFYNQLSDVDYDIIGLSYYPIWHGKSLSNLKKQMADLSKTHDKKILIAETAYPFTLQWNDWTTNIVGLDEHLITPEYPASKEGQQAFLRQLISIIKEVDNGIGFCYWGAELTAWNGNKSTEGSAWENQALFDFQNKALPVLKEFKMN
jgi:arabinogalactan endo-1,4-beta-galactosidase